MPNSIAYAMLAASPLFTLAMFVALSPRKALIYSILFAYMFLPERVVFDLPLVPALDKSSIPNLTILVFSVLIFSAYKLIPRSIILRLLLILFLVSPIATVLTNGDPYFDGAVWMPGLRTYDIASILLYQFIVAIPYFVACALVTEETEIRDIVSALMWCGLAYSFLMLVEIRLSPQLHNWVYGFMQHSFGQTMRGGGFRPMVFMPHGLWLGMFMFLCVLSAAAIMKYREKTNKFVVTAIFVHLFVVLVLAKSFGVLLYALFFLPILLLFSARTQIRIACIISVIVIFYPMLRGAGFVPTEQIVAQFNGIDEERAQSLEYRFDMENFLLSHAQEKPVFGWGSFGRNNKIIPEYEMYAVQDGRWIIVIGIFGWLGYLVEFGLLAAPIFLLWMRCRGRVDNDDLKYSAALALMLSVNLLDLLLNATLVPMTWMLAGAVLGCAEGLRYKKKITRDTADERTGPRPRSIIVGASSVGGP